MHDKTNENYTAYSKQDLKYAAEFRDGVHKEALERVRRLYPDARSVVDRYAVEDYFQEHWDYPGKWYTIVAIPGKAGSRAALIDTIVRDTLDSCARSAAGMSDVGVEIAERVCADSPKTADSAPSRKPQNASAEADARCPDDPFYAQIAAYPDCVLDYCIVTGDPLTYRGCESHRQALSLACRKRLAKDGWYYDVNKARGKRIDTAAVFTSVYPKDGLNYRKAFLYPPHGNNYTGVDFVKVNAALFPNGTDELEVYEWSTDWSDYFDEGHEWWGAFCYTLYDNSLDRFAVILASATD